jgi:hypothetical protein
MKSYETIRKRPKRNCSILENWSDKKETIMYHKRKSTPSLPSKLEDLNIEGLLATTITGKPFLR